MCKVLIFGGTTEGRILAEYCHEKKINAWVSVATGYGRTVLLESEYLHIHESPMAAHEMEGFIKQNGITLVLDATHPYATLASENIRSACKGTETSCIRVIREPSAEGKPGEQGEGKVLWAGDLKEAILALHEIPGNILVTTGSKELSAFTGLDSWEERVFARVLPGLSVISACEQMGFKGKHLIAMQGPFTADMNRAMIRQYDIRCLVTKEAGNAGGFPEKMEAAADCGITAVVIGRPGKEEGITVRAAKKLLSDYIEEKFQSQAMPEIHARPGKRKVSLIGTGMGGEDQMTVKAWKELRQCDVVFGAERMLSGISPPIPHAVKIPFYTSRDILPWLEKHKEFVRIGILYSGDTGFYSGAKKMAEALGQEPYCQRYDTVVLPGISSVSYLCSRLKTDWEDVRLVSLHGRTCDIIKELTLNPRVFVLLDGINTVKSLCRLLKEQGLQKVRLSVGERLSYPDERITVGTPEELEGQDFDLLSAVLIERQG
ncbi:MAG: precorrin-6A reductase [Hungatella sp.]|jgi:precorrin-6x reductase|nr:precorrin-6A reductase [Hungatella sp.]